MRRVSLPESPGGGLLDGAVELRPPEPGLRGGLAPGAPLCGSRVDAKVPTKAAASIRLDLPGTRSPPGQDGIDYATGRIVCRENFMHINRNPLVANDVIRDRRGKHTSEAGAGASRPLVSGVPPKRCPCAASDVRGLRTVPAASLVFFALQGGYGRVSSGSLDPLLTTHWPMR